MFKQKSLKLKNTDELFEYGKKLGAFPAKSRLLPSGIHADQWVYGPDEVLPRVIEVERSIRQSQLWWVALFSAIGSILSGLAALLAVLFVG